MPWLALLAATHGMVLYRRKEKGLPLTLALSMAGFILVVYSTFLTRSGILGETSVHAFTDLGLSGQLLLFLISFVIAAVAMFLYGRRQLKENEAQSSFLSLEFWMMLGICLFCLSAFQVLLPTSIPVFNVLLEMLGIEKSLAPPADQVTFYSKFQIWFGVAFCLASGLGQIFYWKRIASKKMLENELGLPIIISLVLTSLFVFLAKTQDISYIFLIGSAIYLIAVSLQIMVPLVKNIQRTSLGGILAHVGMAVMLLGFVYSAGHQKIISKNMAINAPESNLPVHTVRDNLLLSQNVPKQNQGFELIYKGAHYKDRETGKLIPVQTTLPTWNDHEKIIQNEFSSNLGIHKGDTITIDPENIYYNIRVRETGRSGFTLSPRMQNNPQMGYIASPDIQSFFTKDIYTHVTNFPDPEKVRWNPAEKRKIRVGESFELQGLHLTLNEINLNEDPLGIPESEQDFPLEASVTIRDQYGVYTAKPIYHIDDKRSVRLFPDEIKAIGTKVFLSKVDPENQQYELMVMTSQRDWITIESIEMPFISLVWIGALLMTIGIGVSFFFRLVETRESQMEEDFLWEASWNGQSSSRIQVKPETSFNT
ncbi:cytochrome c-type biogenesis CcmF C-terminal domain-containing protein [Echinicola jeungdonensis]|uniref:cytochrome c-type biogenesis CcmF C-terminal domain-containing protein n=1 Tax=Echinicola jeungdonensis TaxID=709343 RepID=UPI0025B4CDAF|nr:cytochrome c-type biogenesis CcmF C-terminal domain-containing protein [Echinicola jeungdonensis]MDN3669149.1 cytochrome c-type biogenesis CcmF C-terminal domain-containing protein [Echinicola jeungdonensis]